jgi:large subunit ribosomal protein L33
MVTCMAKKKGVRIIVTLECTEAKAEGASPSRYTTQKNKKNTPERMELTKYNPFLKRHTLHKVRKGIYKFCSVIRTFVLLKRVCHSQLSLCSRCRASLLVCPATDHYPPIPSLPPPPLCACPTGDQVKCL